jgi:hypothetical protein
MGMRAMASTRQLQQHPHHPWAVGVDDARIREQAGGEFDFCPLPDSALA